MRVTFGSIVLNEAEYLAANLTQHYDFCDSWIVVEGADRRYPASRVTEDGLSTDRTAEIVREFPDPAGKLRFIQHGWADDKSELRNRYAELCDDGILIVFDADEFLSHESLRSIVATLRSFDKPGCYRIPHVHLWKDRQTIITGGYYDVPHNRCYRWAEGSRYQDNHNHPHLPGGVALHDSQLVRFERQLIPHTQGWSHHEPFWLHFGFVKAAENIDDKNRYYLARGEAETRPETTRCRGAWFNDGVPAGCQLHHWIGDMPEVFA